MKAKLLLISVILAGMVTLMSGCGTNGITEPSPSPSATPSSAAVSETADGENTAEDAEKTETDDVSSNAGEGAQQTSKPVKTSKPGVTQNTSKPAVSKAPEAAQTPGPEAPKQTETPVPAQTPAPAPSYTADELAKKLVASLPDNEYNFEQMPSELYSDVYNINVSEFEEVAVYAALMNVKSNELIVIKTKDEAGIAAAKTVLQNRLDALDKVWRRYLPQQYEYVKAGKIVTKGCYAMMVVDENSAIAASEFYEALK